MFGYDPRTGEELWRDVRQLVEPSTPTPVVDGGLIYLTSGYRLRPIFAIRTGASGDISLADGARSNDHVAWSSPRDGPYMSSPLVYQGYLYVVATNGVLTVFDAVTGERAYKSRIAERGGAFTPPRPSPPTGASTWPARTATSSSSRAGHEYELLATNPMDEVCLATPAISEGQLIIRTTGHLVAVRDGIAPTIAEAKPSSAPFPAALAADRVLPFEDFEDGDLFAHTGVPLADLHEWRLERRPQSGRGRRSFDPHRRPG